MLRFQPFASARDARRYYTQSLAPGDYHAAGQSVPTAVWRGIAAERLGLARSPVTRDSFGDLIDNRIPGTRTRLTARSRADRLVGWDLNFHPPKSFSVAALLGDDPRLRLAMEAAVAETMAEIEARVSTRVRRGGRSEDRATGNLLYAAFTHDTTRPVDGIPDPHLHIHAFVFNATFDEEERQWKAAKVRAIVEDAPYFEAAFLSRLAISCVELGYSVVRSGRSWEIAGIPSSAIRKFSRRTAEIESLAAHLDITDPKLKAELGARSRSRKSAKLDPVQLRDLWQKRLTPDERAAINLPSTPSGAAISMDADAAIDHSLKHHLERQSVALSSRVAERALRIGFGSVSPEAARSALERLGSELVQVVRDGRKYLTSSTVLEEEQRLIAVATTERGTLPPLDGGSPWISSQGVLNRGQTAAVQCILGSTSRIEIIRGAAGTGKTTLLREAVTALETRGRRVIVLAPTAEASRGVLRHEGFVQADTIASFLGSLDQQVRSRGGVIVIDEAGLVGTPTLLRLAELANSLDARLVLIGDPRQHSPVERGDALRLLIRHAGLMPAEVTAVVRQRERYKQMVEALSENRVRDAIEGLAAMGSIIEAPGPVRLGLLAGDYVRTTNRGASCLIVAPTHAEGERVTEHVRQALRAAGRLSSVEHEVVILKDLRWTQAERSEPDQYTEGLVIEFHAAAGSDGDRWNRGDRARIIGRDLWGGVMAAPWNGVGPVKRVPLEQPGAFQIYQSRTLGVSGGDLLRITRGGTSRNGSRLNNGSIVQVRSVTKTGGLLLMDGRTLEPGFGHLTHGYVRTSHASQGSTVDTVLIAMGRGSVAAASREQLYVSVSRGRNAVRVYAEDRSVLFEAAERTSERLSAHDLVPEVRASKSESVKASLKHAIGLQRRRVVALARTTSRKAGSPRGPGHGR